MSDLFEELLSNNDKIPTKRKLSGKDYLSPILFKKGSIDEVTVLLDYPVSNYELEILKSRVSKSVTNFSIIQVLPFTITEDNLKKDIVKLYAENHINFQTYIEPHSKILCVGRSIYAITENDMFVKPDHFWDTITFHTHFYSKELQSEIFPVNAVDTWLTKDCFENFFFKCQLQYAKDFEVLEHNPVELIYSVIPFEKLDEYFLKYEDADIVAVDTETNGLDFDTDRLGTIQLSCEDNIGQMLYVPTNEFKKKLFFKKLSKWFHGKRLVFHNGMFDIMFLIENGIRRSDIYYFADTMLLGHIWNEMQVASLKGLLWIFEPDYAGYDKEKDLYMKKYPKANFMDMPPAMLEKYGCYDAILTRKLYFDLMAEFKFMDENYPNTFNPSWGIQRLVNEIAMPSLDAYVCDMKVNGIAINWELLQKTSDEVKIIIEELKQKLYDFFKVSKNTINLSSDEQLGLLIEKSGWKITERGNKINPETGKGVPLTGNRILREWRKQGHDICNTIISLREYEQLYKTFLGAGSIKSDNEDTSLSDLFGLNNYEEKEDTDTDSMLEETDGKGYVAYKRKNRNTVHGSYMHGMTESLRSRMKAPNMQQMITGKHPDQCMLFRRNIIPFNKEIIFASADYSSLQMVGASEMCAKLGIYGNLAKVVRDYNKDFHSKTASGILMNNKVSFEEFRKKLKEGDKVYKEARQKSKSINFSQLFLASYNSLYRNSIADPDLGWTLSEVEDFIESEQLDVTPFKKGNDETKAKYLCVSSEIHERFMKEYSELIVWSDTYKKFTYEHGFIRSLYGSFRRLPYLQYRGNDSDKKKIANFESICVNSPTQTLEFGVVSTSAIKIAKFIKENKMKSQIILLIHDAIEFAVIKSERDILIPKIKEIMNTEYPDIMCGLPQSIELAEEDYYESKGLHLFDYETKNNDWWDKYKDIVMKYADDDFIPAYLK